MRSLRRSAFTEKNNLFCGCQLKGSAKKLIKAHHCFFQDKDGGGVHGTADLHHADELRGVRRHEADLPVPLQLVPQRPPLLRRSRQTQGTLGPGLVAFVSYDAATPGQD